MRIPEKIKNLISSRKTVSLDIGCGGNKQQGFIGLDKRNLPGVDIVCDLETFPWPLPDSCASTILLSHFLEHVKPWVFLDLMAEIHRVSKDGAQIMVAGPYGVEFRFIQDPTHCRPINEATFCYFDNRHPLWEVYNPPVIHLEQFDLIPAGASRDFNALLRVCKPNGKGKCPHGNDVPKV